MYLTNLIINNFKSFKGKHQIFLTKGLNIVNGTHGTGKTNLCQAIEFNLFGNLHGHIPNIINHQHEKEKENEEHTNTEVELDLVIDEKPNTITRSLSRFDRNGSSTYDETTYFAALLETKLTRSTYHDLVCIQESTINNRTDENKFKSAGQRVAHLILETAKDNVKNGIKLLLLDDALSRLDANARTSILNKLLELPLEQAVLLETNTPYDEPLLRLNPRVTRLNTRMEKAIITANNFPLPAKNLEDSIRHTYNGTYLNIGDEFHNNIFDHKYYLKVIEATPNGSRFDANTELTITNG